MPSPRRGGGSTVMNTLKGDPTASEALSSEIEVALRSLASKLQAHGIGKLVLWVRWCRVCRGAWFDVGMNGC